MLLVDDHQAEGAMAQTPLTCPDDYPAWSEECAATVMALTLEALCSTPLTSEPE